MLGSVRILELCNDYSVEKKKKKSENSPTWNFWGKCNIAHINCVCSLLPMFLLELLILHRWDSC